MAIESRPVSCPYLRHGNMGLRLVTITICFGMTVTCQAYPTSGVIVVGNLIDQLVTIDVENELDGRDVFALKRSERDSPFARLVRLGNSALPELIAHLGDDRETKSIVGAPALSRWFSNEYDPRFANPDSWPAGVVCVGDVNACRDAFSTYTLKVGDLCYEAIGIIVNRDLRVARSRPTLCLVVTSPTRAAALADAVRRDWSCLSMEVHQQSLISDAWAGGDRAKEALRRLVFYYPKVAETTALSLLARPIYEEETVRRFVGTLMEAVDSNKWGELVREFRSTFGDPPAAAVPIQLRWMFWDAGIVDDAELSALKAKAELIRRAVFSSYDFKKPTNAVALIAEQAEVAEAVSQFQSQNIERALMTAFRAARGLITQSRSDSDSLDDLAIVCVRRLAGKEYDNELRSYILERLQDNTSLLQPDAFRREALKRILQALTI